MEHTWPNFKDRWLKDIDKQIKALEKVNTDLSTLTVEFNLQQLFNAGNFVASAIGELKKCIVYEATNLRSEIGPDPEEVTPHEEEVVEEPITEPEPEPVVEPTEEPFSPFR